MEHKRKIGLCLHLFLLLTDLDAVRLHNESGSEQNHLREGIKQLDKNKLGRAVYPRW